jgi:hypothetical protein
VSSKPIIKYIELSGRGCGLSTDSEANILKREGTANVALIRNATQKDVDWVRGMGGYVPEGRIAKE